MKDISVWSEYHDFLESKIFHVCKNQSVLEIAPYCGHQTIAVVKHNLKSLTLVEPNSEAVDILRSQFPNATVLNKDIFDVYKDELPADVVICCGLLYHLHNSLSLLELIIQQSNPKYIILDSIITNGTFIQVKEDLNTPGNRFASQEKITIPYSITIDSDLINECLNSVGYKQTRFDLLAQFNVKTKENSWIGVWKKEELNEMV